MSIEFSTEQLQKIRYTVVAICRQRDRFVTTDAMDEVFGQALIILVRTALPRFDPSRGGLDPFLRECSARITRTLLRDRMRPLVRPRPATEPLQAGVVAQDEFDAARITDELFSHPEKYLQPTDAATLDIIRSATPGESNNAMAARAGCHPATLCHRKVRLRRAILIAAEKYL